MKLQKVRYEFYSYETGPTGLFNTTLVLDNPASIKFVLTGTGNTTADFCVINNLYNLQPINLIVPGPPRIYPSELILNNNFNEIDKTNYTIRILCNTNTIQLKIVVKYLVK
jgi:hypothetical protein